MAYLVGHCWSILNVCKGVVIPLGTGALYTFWNMPEI